MVLLFFLINSISVFASPTTKITIGGGEIQLQSDNKITVPVNIENNSGIMGFKITAEYPNDILTLQEVKKGRVTSTGNLSTNETSQNKVTILWNNTAQINQDGSLFELVFTVKNNSQNGKIILSYSEQDTFDENYNNVECKIRNIDLIGITDRNSNENGTDNNNGAVLVYNELNDVIAKYDLQNLNEEQKDSLLEEANAVMDNLLGKGIKSFSSVESLKAFYESAKINAAVDEIKNALSKSEIKNILDNNLKKYNSDNISDIPTDKKVKFAEDVKKQLTIENGEVLNELDDEELLKAVDKIAKEISKPKSQIESKGSQTTHILVFVLVGTVVILSVIILIAIKHKKSVKEEKQ